MLLLLLTQRVLDDAVDPLVDLSELAQDFLREVVGFGWVHCAGQGMAVLKGWTGAGPGGNDSDRTGDAVG